MVAEQIAVEQWELSRFVPYARNPRKNEGAVERMVGSIREFGFKIPVLARSTGDVVDGHLRLKAAQKLGLHSVPVMLCDEWSAAQVKAFRLMVNRSVNWAAWDEELLSLELAELKDLNFDLSLTGFDDDEIAGFTAEKTAGLTDEDEVPEAPAEPVTQPGDLWLLGSHRLLCGDSTKAEDVERLMGGQKADLVFTDPPYGMRLNTDFSGIKGSLNCVRRKNGTRGKKYERVIGDHEDFSPRLIETIFECLGYCAEMFLWGADYYADLIPARNHGAWLVWDKRKESQAEAIGSEFELCWSKAKHKRRMLRHDWFGFLSSANASEAQHRVHPTQKPTSLIVDVLTQWGSDAARIVDPYIGSGSTLIACEKTDRACYGMELSPAYCDVIIERWQNFTGETAKREDGVTFADLKSQTSIG